MCLDPGEEETAGLVRLATSDSLSACLLHEDFPRIRTRYPGVRLNVATAGTMELFRMLDRNEADMVCTLDSHIYDTNYVIASEEKIGVHFVASRENPLARKGVLTGEDLLSQDFLLTEKGMSYRRLLDEWLAKNSLEINPVLETGRVDLICELVEQGMGMAFLPDYATEAAVARGAVVRLDAEGFRPELWKQILYHREKWLTPAMEAVLELLTEK
jgi:DNA-binding transcriptional LysR family regulator